MKSTSDRYQPPRVAVAVETGCDDLEPAALALARDLGLPLVGIVGSGDGSADLLLTLTRERLELRETGPRVLGSVFVDFERIGRSTRSHLDLTKKQPIARAVGLRKGPVRLLDATAGLGRDTLLLASLGCTVCAVERSPVLGAMLKDGLERAARRGRGSAGSRAIVDGITLIIGDANNVLSEMARGDAPDVVYLDPMYPIAPKRALAKKEMRMCRRLVGDDPDACALLQKARAVARKRVVLKLHRRSPPLLSGPDLRYLGQRVRYDVYLRHPPPAKKA